MHLRHTNPNAPKRNNHEMTALLAGSWFLCWLTSSRFGATCLYFLQALLRDGHDQQHPRFGGFQQALCPLPGTLVDDWSTLKNSGPSTPFICSCRPLNSYSCCFFCTPIPPTAGQRAVAVPPWWALQLLPGTMQELKTIEEARNVDRTYCK